MSLRGSLSDLNLGDIFQIVSLSRRSGTLKLESDTVTGEITFIGGRVVAADCEDAKQTVAEALLEIGVVEPTTLQEMLAAQSKGVRTAAGHDA